MSVWQWAIFVGIALGVAWATVLGLLLGFYYFLQRHVGMDPEEAQAYLEGYRDGRDHERERIRDKDRDV